MNEPMVRVTRAVCLKCGREARAAMFVKIPAVVPMAVFRDSSIGASSPCNFFGCDGQMQIEMEPA